MSDKYHQVYVEYKQRAETRIAQLEAERDAALMAVAYADMKMPSLFENEFAPVAEAARKLGGE